MPLAFIALAIGANFDGSYGVAVACLVVFLVMLLRTFE
jgi:hypothetical protein